MPELTWTCPRCGQVVECNPIAHRLLEAAGGCQGCRLQDTFAKTDPATTIAIVEYLKRTNSWPEGGEAQPVTDQEVVH